MIRRLLICAPLLALAACALPVATGPSAPPVAPPPAAGTFINTVLADIKIGCNIVADADPIVALVGTVPYLSSAEAIANLACKAFAAPQQSTRLGASTKLVAVANGVTLTGRRAGFGHRRHGFRRRE